MSDELAAAIDELGQVRMQLDLKFFEFCDEGFGVAESRRRLLTPPWRTPPLAAPRRPSPHTGRRGRRVPQVTHRFRRPGAPQPVTHLLLLRFRLHAREAVSLPRRKTTDRCKTTQASRRTEQRPKCVCD